MGSRFSGQQFKFALVSDLDVIKEQAAACASPRPIGQPDAFDVRPGTALPLPKAEA